MSIPCRRAGLADLDKVAPLFDAYRQFYGQPSDPARARRWLEARLARGEAQVVLAERDHRALGFALLYPTYSSLSTAATMVLNDLYVAEDARRDGVATALLEAALACAREGGALRVSLETARDNLAAQALYRKAGWSEDATLMFHRAVAP